MKTFPQRILFAVLGTLLGALTSPDSSAWSMGGHRVTGVLAAREIFPSDPRVIDAITTIMQAHPAANTFLERVNEAGADPGIRLERLFAEMAQWPDEIRRGPLKEFHHGAWHTMDIPFVAPGFKPANAPQPPDENLLWALHENLRIAGDPAQRATDRAVALCWIFHLLGDLHQPLHTASFYNPAFPSGDRNGGQFWVRPPAGDEVISLHYFWDSIIQRTQNMPEVENTAAHLHSIYPRSMLEELRSHPYHDSASLDRWAIDESRRIAVSDAYRGGLLAGAADKKAAPRLSAEYAADTRLIAARRMALSGYRLADVLRVLFQ